MDSLAIAARQEPVHARRVAKTIALGLLIFPCIFAAGQDFSQPQPDLIAAVVVNDGERVAALLAAGADVHETWVDGVTALHLAAAGFDAAMVEQLVAAGANVHATAEGTAATPLHMAAANRDGAVAKALINAGASVAAVTTEGATPLALAVLTSNEAVVQVLIEAGAEVKVEPSEQRFTLLHVAASNGAREVAAALVAAGAHLEATDAAGHTPLHHAAERVYEDGGEGVAQLLIDAGANVNAQDGSGLTALHMAVGSNRHVLAEYLLDAGANIDAKANESGGGTTPLHVAAAGGWLDCVGLLLRRGAAVDPQAPGIGTPLLAAVENGKEYVAAALVEHGADASVKNERGETAATIAERKGMTTMLARLHEKETGTPARDIDPEVLVDMLNEAVKRDAPDTVLRLLDGVDALELGFAPLHEAAGRGSLRVARALLDAGFDANFGGTKPLHMAARHESPEVAALLIERGAEVNASDNGWTPLHYALLDGLNRPGLRTAKLLVEQGADVNATTTAMGWTPLHFAAHLSGAHVSRRGEAGEREWIVTANAHGPDVLQLVRSLIERGADANSRTRIGGWTPLRVAMESDDRRRHPVEPSESSEAVLAALQAAGGKDEGCDDAPELPTYAAGWWEGPEQRPAAVAPGCEYNLSFTVPIIFSSGGRSMAGSFTAAGAQEALLFEGVGLLDGYRWFDVVSLRDRHGAVRPIMAIDHYTDYEGLCLDAQTNTHAAVFTRRYDGSCCPWEDTVYYHYDADAGNLVEILVDDAVTQPTGTDAECRWRDKAAGLAAYQDALSALRVGDSPGSWPWDEHDELLLWEGLDDDVLVGDSPKADERTELLLWEGLLPTRTVSAEVVESQLEVLRGLPDVVRVWNADSDSPERKVVVAEYVGIPRPESVDVCEGVLLAWDEARQEWRSIYDCAGFSDIEISGDTLSAALYIGTADCGLRRQGRLCYLQVDLTTWLAELWDEPHGNYWRNSRDRPSR